MQRRRFLHAVGASVAAVASPLASAAAQLEAPGEFWHGIRAQYDVDRTVTNLENAYWGVMARPVATAYLERIRFVNRVNVVYARDAVTSQPYSADVRRVVEQIARAVGAEPGEIAPTRGGTEALQNLIVNYNGLSAGDAVICADLDFDAMQFAMEYLAARSGARVVRLVIPEPATHAGILDAYDRILRDTPRAKLLLVTHISHRTGLLMPVADIVRMARLHGVDVVVDAAQSAGQVAFDVRELDVDFAGFSLHKWFGAPLGTGALYIRTSRLQDVDPHFDNRDFPPDDIRARVLTGTTNFAALLTVPDALAFHARVGAQRKEQRLRALRDRWVSAVGDVKEIQVLTGPDPSLYAATTSFRIAGRSAQDVQRLLVNRYRILTAARTGIAGGDAVRVTPALYTTEAEVDRLAAALRVIARG
jgi:isopenicillin-N epimerase